MFKRLFDRQHDQEDQRKDLTDLKEKLNEISQKMLEKQCEQYRMIDRMIERAFSVVSFLF